MRNPKNGGNGQEDNMDADLMCCLCEFVRMNRKDEKRKGVLGKEEMRNPRSHGRDPVGSM